MPCGFRTVQKIRADSLYVVGCAGKGDTQAEARESFAHWEPTFQRMQGSLVFETGFNADAVMKRTFAMTAGVTLVQAAINVIAVAAFWCALRRLKVNMPALRNQYILALITVTAILNFLIPVLATLFQAACILLGLASIPMWLISVFVRPKKSGSLDA